MSDLKKMFESMGFGQVHTYIQSGNVLFQSQEDAEPLRRTIEREIRAVFGLEVTVVLRTLTELEQIVRNCPFLGDELQEAESLHVALMADEPSEAGLKRLLPFTTGVDEYRIAGKQIYILYRQSSHKSRLSNNFFEQKLRVSSTARNWQTINKLVEMGNAIEQ